MRQESMEEIKWLAGITIALAGLIGGIIVRDRFVMRLISTEDEATRRMVRDESDKLHDRVNRVRDEYVRRTDLDGHIQRLDANVQQLSREIRDSSTATNQRLDAVLSHLVGPRGHGG